MELFFHLLSTYLCGFAFYFDSFHMKAEKEIRRQIENDNEKEREKDVVRTEERE